tara:strand:+ start:994 stop:1194 length:201 start_codon:yes stop_codon:yes gene_type:complete
MKHSSNGMRKVIKQLESLGIKVKKTKKGLFLMHPNVKESYLMHYGERAIHPVRRWVKRHFGVDIKF